jgi:hypothetical protein
MAAKIKKTDTDLVCLCTKKIGPINEKVKIIITWYCKNEKKDPDNISFAKKFICDGLVSAGVLENDGWKQIQGFEDIFIVDKINPRVEIELKKINNGEVERYKSETEKIPSICGDSFFVDGEKTCVWKGHPMQDCPNICPLHKEVNMSF